MRLVMLSPPLVFVLLFFVITGLLKMSKRLSFSGEDTYGKRHCYVCGEEPWPAEQLAPGGSLRPDYRQFFGAAFFFTVIEVSVLLIATAPSGKAGLPGVVLLAMTVASVFGLVMEVL